jgi:hypothetical protein
VVMVEHLLQVELAVPAVLAEQSLQALVET